MGKVKEILEQTWRWVRKFSTRESALFLFFVAMAAGFWLLLTFNTQMTQDVTVNLKIKKPANVTLLQETPKSLTMTVRDRGTMFLKLFFRSTPTVEIDFNRYCDEKTHTLAISAQQLINEVKHTVRREATVVKVHPETINVTYTTLPGKKVPVNWEDNITNITTDKQFVINPDGIATTPDSVTVYALDRKVLQTITEADITTVEVENLTSSFDKQVRIKPVNNVRIVPSTVKLHVPVEPLIKKEQDIPIAVRNEPFGINVLLFPPTVKVSYLLPQSKYKEPSNLTIVVDYNDIDLSTNQVKIKPGEVSGIYYNVTLALDSVDYVIERS